MVAYNRASRWPVLVSLAPSCEIESCDCTNDTLHLRKLARLLLDTHDGSVVVAVRGGSIDKSSSNFLVEQGMPRVRPWAIGRFGQERPCILFRLEGFRQ
jgi:hypothetical protein